jgi:hypothetical protein
MNGLLLYDMNEFNHRVFGAKEGLLGSEFNDSAYDVAADGSLYFGTTNGLAIIRPSEIVNPPTSKRLFFTRAVLYKDQHNESFPLIDKWTIQTDHKTYAVKIQFSDLNYTASHQTRYAYKLSDKSNNWIDIGNDNSITLNNLGSGKHVLQLKNRNSGADWGEVKTLNIIVSAPW